MKKINEESVIKNITIDDAIEIVRSALISFSTGEIIVPGRITMDIGGDNNSVIILPVNFLKKPYYGFKQASTFPENTKQGKSAVNADIHLYSAETGEPLAVIEANYLTALKTAAAAAVATQVLATERDSVFAIIGSGIQSREQIKTIQNVRVLKEVRLYDVNRERVEQFKDYVENIKNCAYQVTIAATADECVAGANIVSTNTTSLKPVFSGKSIAPGTHINAIGSYKPNMQEIDQETIIKASKIVTDNQAETWEVAGDLLIPLQQGLISKSDIHGNLGDILTGKIPGRTNSTEITLYESVGFSVLDLAFAIVLYEKIETNHWNIN